MMKTFNYLMSVLLASWLLWPVALPGLKSSKRFPSASQCVECHTDVKKLIRLSWEVEKIKGAPVVSAETVGEG